MSDFSWSLLIWSAVNYWRTIWRILMSELTVTLEQHPTGKKWLWERCCRDPFPFFILWSLNEKCVCALCKNAPRSPQSWFSPPRKHALVLTMPHSLGEILISVHFNVVFKIFRWLFPDYFTHLSAGTTSFPVNSCSLILQVWNHCIDCQLRKELL